MKKMLLAYYIVRTPEDKLPILIREKLQKNKKRLIHIGNVWHKSKSKGFTDLSAIGIECSIPIAYFVRIPSHVP